MTAQPQVSVIITNYNYGRFLRDAIDSALGQTHPDVEVIVVDDGSTDDSREAMAEYGDRIVPLLQANGGQISAFNLGFSKSRGDSVCFLDADDTLYPTALENSCRLLIGTDAVKVHWPLRVVDAAGSQTGAIWPSGDLPDGNFREVVIREGPDTLRWPPTSGNAWARSFLENVFPLPPMGPELKRQTAGAEATDAYLCVMAALYGPVRRIVEPQGTYRVHGGNSYATSEFERKLSRDLLVSDHLVSAVHAYCAERRIEVDLGAWRRNSWFHRLSCAIQEIEQHIPNDQEILLIDGNAWGCESIRGRRVVPFLERDGRYWGAPSDDATAIAEFERLHRNGVRFMVVAWPAFWWLEHYSLFHQYLRTRFTCLLENDRLVIFQLQA